MHYSLLNARYKHVLSVLYYNERFYFMTSNIPLHLRTDVQNVSEKVICENKSLFDSFFKRSRNIIKLIYQLEPCILRYRYHPPKTKKKQEKDGCILFQQISFRFLLKIYVLLIKFFLFCWLPAAVATTSLLSK